MPNVAITLTPALTRLFPGCPRQLELEAVKVRGLLDALDRRWPGMRDRLSNSTPRIRPHVNIFVDGDEVGFGHAAAARRLGSHHHRDQRRIISVGASP